MRERGLTGYLVALLSHRDPGSLDPNAEAKRFGIRADWARAYLNLELQARPTASRIVPAAEEQPALL